eukprot:3445843-Pleurochrysis_carterae.AAC.1
MQTNTDEPAGMRHTEMRGAHARARAHNQTRASTAVASVRHHVASVRHHEGPRQRTRSTKAT